MYWLLVHFLFFAASAVAQSDNISFTRNARTFEAQHASLTAKGMAQACLSTLTPDGLPCNPALTLRNKKPVMTFEGLLSNGYENLEKVRLLMDKEITQEAIDKVFVGSKTIQIEGNADINFRSKYLSGQYSPASVKAFSVIRNEANPDIELFAVQESGFTLQTGYEIYEGLLLGVQGRLVQRKFIRQRFKLAELATPEGKALLKPKEQTATYIEPGAVYFLPLPWKPRISVFIPNIGSVSKSYDEFLTPIEAQGGFAFSPPLAWGELDISVEMRSMNYDESYAERLRLGILYHFGSMWLSAGADVNGLSSGIYFNLKNISAGIMYSTTQLVNEKDDFYTQTVYVQLGWQI